MSMLYWGLGNDRWDIFSPGYVGTKCIFGYSTYAKSECGVSIRQTGQLSEGGPQENGVDQLTDQNADLTIRAESEAAMYR